MRYMGCILLVMGGFYLGVRRAGDVKAKVATLRAVCAMIELIKNEICSRRTPLNELFLSLSSSAPREVLPFVKDVSGRLSTLGEYSFSEIWRSSADENLGVLSEQSLCAVSEFGQSLGRYEASLQGSAADRAMAILGSELKKLESTARAEEKMHIALGGGLSLIAALMLL